MRSAAVLGDSPSCFRRASAGVLRSSQCHPSRPGRHARVAPATAPPSSLTSSSGSTAQSAVPFDAAGQPGTGNGQVTWQGQPTYPEKPAAAVPPAPSQALKAPAAAPNASPASASSAAPGQATAPIPSSSPGASDSLWAAPALFQPTIPGSSPPPPAASSSVTAATATTPAASSAPSMPPPAPPQLPQTPSDSRVVPSVPPASAAADGNADAGAAATTLLPPTNAPLNSSHGISSGGGGNGWGSTSAAARSPSTAPPATATTAATAATSSLTSKLNGSSGAKLASPGQQPSSSSAAAAPAVEAGLCTGPGSGDAVGGTATALPAGPQAVSAAPAAPAAAIPVPAAAATPTSPGAAAGSGTTPGPAAAGAAAAGNIPPVAPSQPQALPTAAAATPPPPPSPSQAAAGTPQATGLSSNGAVPSAAGTAPQPPGSPTAGGGGGAAATVPAASFPASTPAGTPSSPVAAASAPPPPLPPPPSTSIATPAAATAAGAGAASTSSPAATTAAATAPPSLAPGPASPSSAAAAATATITSANSGFQLRPIHVVIFAAIFLGGALFASLALQFTAGLAFQAAANRVAQGVMKSAAFRQLCVIACAIFLVRFGLNNVLRALAQFSSNPVQWDKSKVYYILKEVYQPLELLLFIAAICTIADTCVPQLIAVPKSTVSDVVRATLSVSFIFGAAVVVMNLKSRFCKENAWQSEMNGDVTAQRRWEAYDKLGTFVIYSITFVLGIQAIGMEVTSVLAIGGIGGLAIGLAGREICENILNGLIIMSTRPFEVGDEVHFFHSNKVVEGMVVDIGWYRTTIRSYEREVFVIPNAIFSKNIVLNITRKNREWRFFEMVCVRVQDVHKVNAIIQDIRRIVRNDQRIITKLHRRIFLDKLTHEDCRIYVSFYVEAQNRESFMAAKQDLLLAFVDCVERNGAKLAVPRTTVQMEPELVEALSPMFGAAAAMAAAKVTMDVQQAAGNAAAAAAARALTDGRTITAEVTSVPSTPLPSSGTAGGAAVDTTATSGKTVTAVWGVPASPGKSPAVGGGSGINGAGAAPGVAQADAGTAPNVSGGGAAVSAPAQDSSKGEGEKAAPVVAGAVSGSVGTRVGGGSSGALGAAAAAVATAASNGAPNGPASSISSGGFGATAPSSGSNNGGGGSGGSGSSPPPAVVVPLVDTSGPGAGSGSGTAATVVTRFSTPPKGPQPSPGGAAAVAAAAATVFGVRRDSGTAASFAMKLDTDESDAGDDEDITVVSIGGSSSASVGSSSLGMIVVASFDDLDALPQPPQPPSAANVASWTVSTAEAYGSPPADASRVVQSLVLTAASSGGGVVGDGGSVARMS